MSNYQQEPKIRTRNNFKNLLKIVAFCLFFLSISFINLIWPLHAEPILSSDPSKNSQAKSSKSPTRIRSEIIDIRQKSQQIQFLKNVSVEKDDSSMVADKMVVVYELAKQEENVPVNNPKKEKSNSKLSKISSFSANSVSNSDQQSKIKRIDAFGNVRIFSNDFVATGDHGYYQPNLNIFVLQENVIVNNGTSIASGDEFIYKLSSKKGEFVGKKSTKINQKDNKKESKNKLQNTENPSDDRVMIIINQDLKTISKPEKLQKNKK